MPDSKDNIETSRLFQKIGIMDDDEFMNIIEKIDLYN
jgi:mRNA interferase MazF